MTYTITLLPDTPESNYNVMDEAMRCALKVIGHMLQDSPLNPPIDPKRELSLAQNLLTTRYWGTLSLLDGPAPEGRYRNCGEETLERLRFDREVAQAWATKTFYAPDLEDFLNVAVNQALLRPFKTGWPGTYLGHTLVYDYIVDNPHSLFREAITPEIKDRLNNGRFWECIPRASDGYSLSVISDCLNGDVLSLDFISKGIELMKTSNDVLPVQNLRLEVLEDTTLEKYFSFLEKAYFAGNYSAELVPLIREGIFALVSWNHENDQPYVRNFKEQLKRPFLQLSLTLNGTIREALADKISSAFDHGEPYRRFKEKVIDALPDPAGFYTLLARKEHGS